MYAFDRGGGRDSRVWTYTYSVPEEYAATVGVGDLVEIPLGPRQIRGFVWAETDSKPAATVRAIARPTDIQLPPTLHRLIDWAARYYRVSPGQFCGGTIPAPVRSGAMPRQQEVLKPAEGVAASQLALTKRQREVLAHIPSTGLTRSEIRAQTGCSDSVLRQLIKQQAVVVERQLIDSEFRMQAPAEKVVYTAEQEAAIAAVDAARLAQKGGTFLLFGVTGSGKTLVYRELAERVIAAGQQVLILLPEIGLTPQLAARFRHTIPDLAVWHSGFSAGHRAAMWQAVAEGRHAAVLGTRSGLFAPLANIGLIIVDEEHDSSYKQDQTPRYHGRDLAVVYARQLGVPCVLGSATPSMESFANVQQGRYQLLTMLKRPAHAQLPTRTPLSIWPRCIAKPGASNQLPRC